MIGKAELLDRLDTGTLHRLAQAFALAGTRPKRSRQNLITTFMRAGDRVPNSAILAALDPSELHQLVERANYRVLEPWSDDQLRDALSGSFSKLRTDVRGFPASFLRRIETIAQQLNRKNCLLTLNVGPPAQPNRVERVEQKCGMEFPADMKRLLLELSGEFFFYWSIAGTPGLGAPDEVHFDTLSDDEADSFYGTLSWDLEELAALDESLFVIDGERVQPCFYDGEGNYLAFTRGAGTQNVVWWCHHDDPLHGRTVASSFDELMSAWDHHYFLVPNGPTIEWMLGDSSVLPYETPVSQRLDSLLAR